MKQRDKPQVLVASDPAIAALIVAEALPENHIEAVADLRSADPLIVATRDSLAKQESDDYGRVSRRYDFPTAYFLHEVRPKPLFLQNACYRNVLIK